MVALAVQLAVYRCQADREVVTLLARLLGRVIAALGVVETIQTSRIDDTMALEQLPETGPDPSAHLDVRHAPRRYTVDAGQSSRCCDTRPEGCDAAGSLTAQTACPRTAILPGSRLAWRLELRRVIQ